MLEVFAYYAGKGECIRLHFAQTHNLFIDSGVTRFAQTFCRICDEINESNEQLDALILTHVDNDHIGGLLTNLRNPSYQFPFDEVWMNHGELEAMGDIPLSVRQNDEVYARLLERGIIVKTMLANDCKQVAGAQIRTFWPQSPFEYSKDQEQQDILLAHRNDYYSSLSSLAMNPIDSHDTSLNNRNSIVFTFRYDNRAILFTGDAWAEDVMRAEGIYDLIKLPHHGSVKNISEDYSSAIRSNNFLVCADGSDHPDKQTIAKLEKWYGNINIFSPCDWWERDFFVENDKEHGIRYFKKEGLVIEW